MNSSRTNTQKPAMPAPAPSGEKRIGSVVSWHAEPVTLPPPRETPHRR